MHSTPSMPMSKIHRFGVCFQNESLDADGVGTSLIRSTVEADAAKPHRAGVNQESWSTSEPVRHGYHAAAKHQLRNDQHHQHWHDLLVGPGQRRQR